MTPTTTTLPYCTVKGFRRCLDLLRSADAPAAGPDSAQAIRVDRAWLLDQGFSPHAVYPVLGALRFLGLIDASGRPTEVLASFLDPDDLAGRRAAVETAYADVLADLDMPVADREVVDKLLIEAHGCAPGVAAFCSTLLLWLAADSGLPVARPGRRRRGRPPAHLAQLTPAARRALEKQLPADDDDASSNAFGDVEETPLPAPAPSAGRSLGAS